MKMVVLTEIKTGKVYRYPEEKFQREVKVRSDFKLLGNGKLLAVGCRNFAVKVEEFEDVKISVSEVKKQITSLVEELQKEKRIWATVRFTGGEGSRCIWHKREEYVELVFGIKGMLSAMAIGFKEYKTMQKWFPEVKGVDVITAIVCHEFAHADIYHRKMRGEKSVEDKGHRDVDFIRSYGEMRGKRLHDVKMNGVN